ncbi:MAG: hypothetical protein QF717_09100, partial [SAR202 cluster bacterium]|nr:hypothetical protein [SAR202 cluster bacterium]
WCSGPYGDKQNTWRWEMCHSEPQSKNLVAAHAILPEQPQTLLFSGHPTGQETLSTTHSLNDHNGMSDA